MKCYKENSAVLVYYTESSGNSLPTFQDRLSVPLSGIRNQKKKRWDW